jgi:hypothetical protein
MDATVVYVHGIGNKRASSELKAQWDRHLFGGDMGERSRMAYWADILYDRPLTESLVPPSAGAGDEPLWDLLELPAPESFLETVVADVTTGTEGVDTGAGGGTAGSPSERVPPEFAAYASRVTYRAEALAAGEAGLAPSTLEIIPGPRVIRQAAFRALVKVALKDVYAYFFGGKGRAIRARLTEALAGLDGPVVVIGHSLGSVVAYDALREDGRPPLDIPLFMTLGSPLGVTEIQDVVKRPLAVPGGVSQWLNACDARDVVALDPTVRPEYSPADKCVDYIVTNDSDNHHGIAPYLKAQPVQQAAHAALRRNT